MVETEADRNIGTPSQRTARHRRHPLKTLLLLDVLRDRESRPVFYWAVAAVLTGTVAYHFLEGWSLIDSLYFTVITLATVGYGDFTPSTPVARLFTVFFVINGIGIILALFDRIRAVRGERLRALSNSSDRPTPGSPAP
jgi:hypothetical protein